MRQLLHALAFARSLARRRAKVVGADSHGFESATPSTSTRRPAAQALAAFGQVGVVVEGSYLFGRCARPVARAAPGGCWCERSRAAAGSSICASPMSSPGERIVLTGALGPLLYEATSGVMDVRAIERIAGGSQLVINYRAAGFAKGQWRPKWRRRRPGAARAGRSGCRVFASKRGRSKPRRAPA
jgi:hypothetical protein